MSKYSHVFTLAFTVEGLTESGEDVGPAHILRSLNKRIGDICQEDYRGFLEAFGGPDDTAEEDETYALQCPQCGGGVDLEIQGTVELRVNQEKGAGNFETSEPPNHLADYHDSSPTTCNICHTTQPLKDFKT